MKIIFTLTLIVVAINYLPAQSPDKKILLKTHGSQYYNMISADIDNDGLEDFIVNDGGLRWFEGTGDSVWGNDHLIAANGVLNISNCFTIDMNGDGYSDIFYTSGITVLTFGWLQNPGALSDDWINTPIAGIYKKFIGFFDIDGDGDNDLITENNLSFLEWRENIDNNFTITHEIPDGYPPLVLSTTFDGDNDGDLDWVGCFYSCCIRYFENNSNGTFTSTLLTYDALLEKLNAADVNGDGFTDIITSNLSEIQVSTFNTLTNSFNAFDSWEIFDENYDLQFNDLDNDADKDWVFFINNGGLTKLQWIENTGAAIDLNDTITLLNNIPAGAFTISLMDINNDDRSDVWVSGESALNVYTNQLPTDEFGEPFDPQNTVVRMDIMRSFDVDGDLDNDMMVASHDGKLAWFKYNSIADSFHAVHYLPNFEASPYPTLMKEKDIDNDGDLDIITSFRSSYGYEQAAYYCLNNGAGEFSIHPFDDIAFNDIWFTDADEDGDNDLIVMQFSSPGYLQLYLNSGDTASLFIYEAAITATGNWRAFDMIDIDNDGDDDFVGSKAYDSQLQQIINISGGTFNEAANLLNTACTNINSIYTDDFDNDSDIDIIYTCQTENSYIAINNAGSFIPESIGTYISDFLSGPSYTDQVDINFDSIPDLIFGKYNDGSNFKLSAGAGVFESEFFNYSNDFGQYIFINGNDMVDFVGTNAYELYVQYDVVPHPPVFTVTTPSLPLLVENGASDGITFTFTQIPQYDLVINIYPSALIDAGEGEGIMKTITIYSDSSALIPQTYTWNVPDDLILEDIAEGSVQILNDPATWGIYDGAIDYSYNYLISDNEVALYLTSTEVTITEGITFLTAFGHINILPVAPVTLNIIPDSSINAGGLTGETISILIPAGLDGLNDFPIYISVPNDYIHEATYTAEINFDFISADILLDEFIADPITITVNDNDYAFISTSFPGSAVTEGIEPISIGFNLTSAPLFDVLIYAFPDEQIDLGAGPGVAVSTTFIADGTLPVYHNFSGMALEDGIIEGDHSGTINFEIVTGDPFYSAILLADLIINIEEIEIIENIDSINGVTLNYPATDYYPEGTTDMHIELSLLTDPSSSVTIYATPDDQLDLGAGAGVPVFVFFDLIEDATIPKIITMHINDDVFAEGDHIGTVIFSIITDDTLFDGYIIENAIINISDNDMQGVIIADPGTYTFEEGTTDIQFDISLITIPNNNVTIYASTDLQLNLGGGPGMSVYMLFETTDTAVTPQTMFVSITDDILIEGDHTGTIYFTIESDDPALDGYTIAPVVLNIIDNDVEVSISENDTELFYVYPSINNGLFTIQNENITNESLISVINIFGQTMYRETISNRTATLDISFLAAGKYHVVVNNNNHLCSSPIEIIK